MMSIEERATDSIHRALIYARLVRQSSTSAFYLLNNLR